MIAVGLLIILSIPVLVESQTHGLSWGFNSGERFYFKETKISNSSSTVATLSREYYVVAKDNYTIPDPLTYFPFAREETFYYNGTPVMTGRLDFAVPIGNWHLLDDTYRSIHSSYYDTIDIIDEENYWSFRTTKNLTTTEESRISIFSKTDGVLASFLYEVVIDIGYKISFLVERVAPPLILNITILIAGGSIIFVGLMVVYFFRRLRSIANHTETP
jgi:hypothetical protein